MKENINAFVKMFQDNPIKFALFLYGLMVFWLDANYVPIAKHELLKQEFADEKKSNDLFKQAYEIETANHETEVDNQKVRLAEKVDLINKHTEDIVVGRINNAVLEERIKNLKERLDK